MLGRKLKKKLGRKLRKMLVAGLKKRLERRLKKKLERRLKKKPVSRQKRKQERRLRLKRVKRLSRKAEEEARKKAEEEAKAEEARRARAEEEAVKAAQEQLRRQAMEEESARMEEFAKSRSAGLPKGAEEFLGKYMSVDSISSQMKKAIISIDEHRDEPKNLVILCKHGFGTTNIGVDFAKSFYAMGVCKSSTVAVIKAAAFNKVNLNDAVSKLQGGCLVIENAGNVRPDKVAELADVIADPKNDIAVILTGEIDSLSRLFSANEKIVPYFKHLIQMHRIDNGAVFEIAQNYIKQLGYEADGRALSKLKNLMLGVEDGNLDRVLKMINEAVGRAEERTIQGLGSSDASDKKVLLESDF